VNKKILIVEDEEAILQLLIEICSDAGDNKIFSARDGDEGLKLAKDNNPDLILLDVLLPKMNGHDLCRSVRSLTATPRAKVLMISGMSQASDVQKAIDCGADSFIAKPFSYSGMMERITQLLEISA
jgi:two-component system alkaline phosphatase synthesis response regulator PhoP